MKQLRKKVPGTRDDYAFTIHAAIDCWLASGQMNYYRVATKLADAMIDRFFRPHRRSVLRHRRAARWPGAAGRLERAAQAAAGFTHAGRQSHRGFGAG